MSAIVTTRNSGRVLDKCLSSITNQSYRDVDLIVVDNASSDGTQEIARRHGALLADCGPERSAQRNLGARLASGTHLLFLDADMELTPQVVQECARLSGEYEALIIPEKTVGDGWIAKTRAIERGTYIGSFLFEAARFVSRTVFNDLGGYDEQMTGPEDYDFEARLEARGVRIGHIEAPILHHEEDATLAQHLRKRGYYAKSLARYVDAHPDRSRVQFGPARILHYAKHLGSSPWALTQVLFLKSVELAASSARVLGRPVTREDIY